MTPPKRQRRVPQYTVLENGVTRALEHGELTAIVIGTVAAAEKGIRPVQVTMKLRGWGIEIANHTVTTLLANLHAAGRIDRTRRGVYEGV